MAAFDGESGTLREPEAEAREAEPEPWTCLVCGRQVPRTDFPTHVAAHDRQEAAQERRPSRGGRRR